jgi:hypothetical protein
MPVQEVSMLRVKLFDVKGGTEVLESRVNEWLSQNPEIEVVSYGQSSSGNLDNHTTISILYKG